MTYPVFATGDVLAASDMNAVGLWLVKTQTVGSGVSSVTVSSAFSSTYDNYLITLSGGTCSSANVDIRLQLRTGSTTSTTGYYSSLVYWSSGSGLTSFNETNASQFSNAGGGADTAARMKIDLMGPYLAQRTSYAAPCPRNDVIGQSSGYHNVATSYDQFVLFPASGTITGGTIRVYGYRN